MLFVKPKKKRLFSLPVAVFGYAGMLAMAVQAGYFDGGAGAGDPSWNNALNWSDDAVPTSATGVQAIDAFGGLGYGVEVKNAGATAITVDVGTWTHPGLLTVTYAGTLTTVGDLRVAMDSGVNSTLSNGGEITIGANLELNVGNSLFNMNGGTVNVAGALKMIEGGTGHINLHSGTITTGGLELNGNGGYTIDVRGDGKLIAAGDQTGGLDWMVNAGLITAYGGASDVVVEYNMGLNQTSLFAFSAPYGPVAVENGGFTVKQTGDQFFPVGFNYIDLRMDDVSVFSHDTFNPNHYDAATVSANLADISAAGFNTVRVFIDIAVDTDGVVEAFTDTELSSAYMQCVADFLEQAHSHDVYVLISFSMLPGSASYSPLLDTVANVDYPNSLFLNPGWITAKRLFMADFIQALDQIAPERLADTVFAFDPQNEVAFHLDHPPFSLSAGTVTPANGKTYNLATDKLRLIDEMGVYWVNQMAEEIRRQAPGVLVDINTFTYYAVQRSMGDFSLFGAPGSNDWRDRYPFRPEALAASGADFYDLHAYTANSADLQAELDSIDFPAVSSVWSAAGKPMIIGEFGAFKDSLTLSQSVTWKRAEVDLFAAHGFQGWLYWTYNSDLQVRLWNAKSGGGEIFDALAKGARGNYFGYPPVADDPDGDGMPDSWEFISFWTTSYGADDDPDGDGIANRDEYLAGTHPNDSGSKFKIVDVQADGIEMQIGWSTVSGKTYQVLRSGSLVEPSWSTVGIPVHGTGSPASIIVPDAAEQGFYKVRLDR